MVGQDDNEELGLHPWVLPKASLVSRLLLISDFYHVLLSPGVPLTVFVGWLRQQEISQDQNGENTNIPWTESILLVLCTEVLCEVVVEGKGGKPSSSASLKNHSPGWGTGLHSQGLQDSGWHWTHVSVQPAGDRELLPRVPPFTTQLAHHIMLACTEIKIQLTAQKTCDVA